MTSHAWFSLYCCSSDLRYWYPPVPATSSKSLQHLWKWGLRSRHSPQLRWGWQCFQLWQKSPWMPPGLQKNAPGQLARPPPPHSPGFYVRTLQRNTRAGFGHLSASSQSSYAGLSASVYHGSAGELPQNHQRLKIWEERGKKPHSDLKPKFKLNVSQHIFQCKHFDFSLRLPSKALILKKKKSSYISSKKQLRLVYITIIEKNL